LALMELAALLELLYSARERWQTLTASVHRRSDPARELELLKARGLYREPQAIPPEEGSWEGKPLQLAEVTTRLWAAHPYLLRWETTFVRDGLEQTSVGVKDGELFWERIGDDDIHTNEGREPLATMTAFEEVLLDPSPLLGVYRFELGLTTRRLNRRAVEVTALRRPGTQRFQLASLSDHLVLVVDRERGVLLHASLVVDGEELSSSEVLEITFDEPIQPDLFRPLS
jgi:hypothetical protein